MSQNHRLLIGSTTLVILLAWIAMAGAQASPPPFSIHALDIQTGSFANKTAVPAVVYSEIIRFDGAAWLHFRFGEFHLGASSTLTLRSLADDGTQRHTQRTLTEWQGMSAVFNGDAVEIVLVVAPGDTGVQAAIAQVYIGDYAKGDEAGLKSLCGGDDDRGASTNDRVGRLFFGGCTSWQIANSAFITAGHCCDFDPDDQGPLLPDGVRDLSGVVEFHIPQSLANGTVVAASPDDQYPINVADVTWEYPGGGGDIGDDWCVFAVGANSNTGLFPWQAQGFFRVAAYQPADDATVRITGCGVDVTPPGTSGGENSASRTLQTANGPYKGVDINGGKIAHKYRVDTEGANSGSPIIYDANGVTIGVHTTGGCDGFFWSYNAGTAFGRAGFYTAVREFLGTSVYYVDNAHPNTSGTGTIFNPTLTVAAGVGGITSGWSLQLVRGTYAENLTISKAMTLRAPVGTVLIGSTAAATDTDNPRVDVPEAVPQE